LEVALSSVVVKGEAPTVPLKLTGPPEAPEASTEGGASKLEKITRSARAGDMTAPLVAMPVNAAVKSSSFRMGVLPSAMAPIHG
jgi:hypothetical protein